MWTSSIWRSLCWTLASPLPFLFSYLEQSLPLHCIWPHLSSVLPRWPSLQLPGSPQDDSTVYFLDDYSNLKSPTKNKMLSKYSCWSWSFFPSNSFFLEKIISQEGGFVHAELAFLLSTLRKNLHTKHWWYTNIGNWSIKQFYTREEVIFQTYGNIYIVYKPI